MKNTIPLVLFVAMAVLTSGCSTMYCDDRRNDLTDVVHIDFSGIALGASANVGPLILGGHIIAGPEGPGFRTRYGLGGSQETESVGITAGLIYPLARQTNEDARSRVGYSKDVPPWGSVGVDIGLLWGISARVDFVEFLDFLLGWFRVDILEDDQQFDNVNTGYLNN